jgi:hypothetical protein
VEPCRAPGFERACSAVAVLEKLDVSNLISLKTSQEGKGRRNFLPGHVRFVGKRAEEGDAVTLLNRVGDLEVERLPIALDRSEDIEQFLRSLCECRSRA